MIVWFIFFEKLCLDANQLTKHQRRRKHRKWNEKGTNKLVSDLNTISSVQMPPTPQKDQFCLLGTKFLDKGVHANKVTLTTQFEQSIGAKFTFLLCHCAACMPQQECSLHFMFHSIDKKMSQLDNPLMSCSWNGLSHLCEFNMPFS